MVLSARYEIFVYEVPLSITRLIVENNIFVRTWEALSASEPSRYEQSENDKLKIPDKTA